MRGERSGVMLGSAGEASGSAIDRRALVTRHKVVRTECPPDNPIQVGNGEFAFGADITGLQTFHPFSTMSHWGWHASPVPPETKIEEFRGEVWETHGRPVSYPTGTPEQETLASWLYANPHRFNLGRLGLELTRADGRPATLDDLENPRQELDLWHGTLRSTFEFEGQPVVVETCCHPRLDAIAVRIESPLLRAGRLAVRLEFPYADIRPRAGFVGDWNQPEAHQTTIRRLDEGRADLARQLDSTQYHVSLAWGSGARLESDLPGHRLVLASEGGDRLELVCAYSPEPLDALPDAGESFAACRAHWPEFWRSGGAVDLSASTDPRWRELERRIILSQYLMAVNEAGSLPPQEAGLVNIGWHGKFHLEMTWWHAAHYALWDRWPVLERGLGFYRRFLPSARERAREQGYRGARWPKCTGPEGRESPHPIHALLIWQQPHPIFFAELDYRAHPSEETLAKWRDVVFSTADFLASYAFLEEASGRFVLGPPLYVVSENTDPRTTGNPAFELSYWRFGLRLAQTWRERLGLARDAEWERVLQGLAPLPEEEGVYVLHEGVQEMWTRFNWEHPALTGVYGLLPGDGVDVETARRTLDKVVGCWNFERTWGWDFPMLAMAAARLGEPERAVEMLLHPAPGFRFTDTGLATGGPFPYFPSNGGLLYAVAMMAAGWDGAPTRHAPGFPEEGWVVRCEGLRPAL